MLGMIRGAYTFLDGPTLIKLYSSLIRPLLEYSNVAWTPVAWTMFKMCLKRQRGNFFRHRVVNRWNMLTENIVTSPSVHIFKNRLKIPFGMFTNLNKAMIFHAQTVFCPGFQKGRVPSEKGTFSAVNGPSKGHH